MPTKNSVRIQDLPVIGRVFFIDDGLVLMIGLYFF